MTAEQDGNPFSGAWLERRAHEREEADWAARALAEDGTLFVVASGTRHLVRRDGVAAIAFLDATHPLVRGNDPAQLVLLGRFQGARCVLLEAQPEGADPPAGTHFEELRPLLGELPGPQAALLVCARALQVWRGRHRHCGTCGALTAPRQAGHCLRCTRGSCGAEYFPRLDPAVIVLVSDGEHALLGRQAAWPPGRYSTLAGFVEPGESLEDTVIREVREETGVCARAPRYFASQPWPFPASLMLGFHATAERGTPLQLDGELEDARWFSAAELAGNGALLPPRYTIARRLIDAWYRHATGAELAPCT
ncbi:MAG TPA: NAD(+) diphosphatase [Burkholderiaceae bacterium]|nr:NAD(+) diphosphatase [Burkholderiaceae bacterium]